MWCNRSELFARWPKLRGREAGRAVLRVGVHEKKLDQRSKGGRWVRALELDVDTPTSVTAEQRGVAGTPLAIDALRFVQVR